MEAFHCYLLQNIQNPAEKPLDWIHKHTNEAYKRQYCLQLLSIVC